MITNPQNVEVLIWRESERRLTLFPRRVQRISGTENSAVHDKKRLEEFELLAPGWEGPGFDAASVQFRVVDSNGVSGPDVCSHKEEEEEEGGGGDIKP